MSEPEALGPAELDPSLKRPEKKNVFAALLDWIMTFGSEFMIAVFLGWMVEFLFACFSQTSWAGRLSAFCVLWFGSGAAFFIGTLTGFLFGFPKARTSAASAKMNADYGDNTNLEEVSDWLTKIIIGIGLVEFDKIVSMVAGIGSYMGNSIGGEYSSSATTIATGSLVYGFVCGFLYYYIWARIRLIEEFRRRMVRNG